MVMDLIKYCKNNELKVHIIPSAPKNVIKKYENGTLYITIAAPPDKGKANLALCKYLKKLTKKQFFIKSGQHSHEKVLVFF